MTDVVFGRAAHLTCWRVSLRRNAASLRRQHLAKVYDLVHPRENKKDNK